MNTISQTDYDDKTQRDYIKAVIVCNPENIVEIYDISYVTGDSNKVVNCKYYTGEEILINTQKYYYSYDITWLEVVDLNGNNLGYVDYRYVYLVD